MVALLGLDPNFPPVKDWRIKCGAVVKASRGQKYQPVESFVCQLTEWDLLRKHEKAKLHSWLSVVRLEVRSLTVPAPVMVSDISRTFRHEACKGKHSEQSKTNTVKKVYQRNPKLHNFSSFANLQSRCARMPSEAIAARRRSQITEAWSHVDGTRIRLVMGPTKFPWINPLVKPEKLRFPLRMMAERPCVSQW